MHGYSALVRRLGASTFNYWFGYVANAAWVLWLVSRGVQPGPDRLSAPSFIAFAALGLLTWTLAEYVLHRYVYHVWPSFLSHGHGLHHAEPRALIGVPWWLTSLVMWALYSALCRAFSPGPLGVTMGSCWAGYMAYCLLHHGSHHWAMRAPYLRNMKRLHQLHHAYPAYNWGFTTSLWDVAFGTYLPDGRRRPRAQPPHPRAAELGRRGPLPADRKHDAPGPASRPRVPGADSTAARAGERAQSN